jgi:hypothetical protein
MNHFTLISFLFLSNLPLSISFITFHHIPNTYVNPALNLHPFSLPPIPMPYIMPTNHSGEIPGNMHLSCIHRDNIPNT